jgi:uncharacterized protein YdbL (DUF1318 family)
MKMPIFSELEISFDRKQSIMKQLRKIALFAGIGAIALTGMAGAAQAQRDPAYEQARSSGKVGEKMDGYLGVVGAETPALKSLVNDINIKRRAVYVQRAQAAKATIEEYALTAGCEAISRTEPGEKYQAPDGTWQTRTEAEPLRDPRCP